jgi:tetratricopeptide (TPR) repeat protein
VIVGGTDGLGKWSALNESLPGRIFISYRHQETAWPARQLYEVLVEHFSAERVFKDVDNIEPGDDFVERITSAVASCEVLLALIGRQWLTVTNKKGQRRLDDPEDYVRVEIETALTRRIRVIPILVDDARMPSVEELPPALAPLARRNAVEISPVTFDTKRLIAAVHKTLAALKISDQKPDRSNQQLAEQDVEQLYDQALAAFWTEQWDQAIELLGQVLSRQPDYADAARKLESARRQQELAMHYAEASAAADAGNWEQAVAAYTLIANSDPDYRDTGTRLANARHQHQLASLLAEAHRLHRARQWAAVIKVGEQLQALDPAVADPDGLITSARTELAAEQQAATLAADYHTGLHLFDDGRWKEAIEALKRVIQLDPTYQDAPALLHRSRRELEQAAAALAEEQAQLDAEAQAQREEAEDAAGYECAEPPAAGSTVEVTEPEPEEALGKGASEVSEAGPDQPAGSSRVPRFTNRRTKVLVTIAVVVVAASAGWLLIRSESGNPGEAPTVAATPNTSSPPTSTTTAPGPAVPRAAAALPKNVIVFPEGTKDNEDIWTVRADGSGRKLLVGNPGTDTWPVISHDRKTVLYVHIEKGGQTLRMVSVDGKDDRVFADVDSICKLTSRPAWSSTGMIAVVCAEGPRIHSIKLVNTDGTVEGTLVPPVDYVDDPAFSNDGRFVVYWKEPSTNELEGGPLYRIGVDGQGERRITDGEPGQDADPAWSPDDDRIAFRRRADRESARDIWIYNVRTGESKALVTGPSNDQDPSWSPDGRHLVYKCGPNGDAEICLVDADGKNPHRLFQSTEPNTAPAWTPR